MTTTPRRAGEGFDPQAVAALAAAIEAGEAAELPPLVPESLANGPPVPKPRAKRKPARKRTRQPVERKHGGGHPRASPEATRAVLEALDAGQNIKSAARAGGVSWPTAKSIWERAGRDWPPPGLRKGTGVGGGNPTRPATVTPEAAREAIRLRGNREPGGNWERSMPSIAAEMGVSMKALRWAIEKVEKRSEEERS